jgi:hypothetical protein
MADLTKLARGEHCLIRVPHICSGSTETVVLCHLRMIGISGYGLKAPDALAAFGCQPCHDFVDGRSHPNNTAEYRRMLLLEGMARTQYRLIELGILKW